MAHNVKRLREVRATENKKSNNKLNFKLTENNQRSSSNPHLAKPVLCDGFLIPMTDFVNNVNKMENYPSHENALSWIYNYATFIKQPLKLEMFVPCDEDGNVLEEPQMRLERNSFDEEDMDYDAQELYDYIKAKEKVLFKHKPQFYLGAIIHIISQGRNIEYLANFGSMQLTKTALNAIFG